MGRWLQFVEERRCYSDGFSDGFSDDSFIECEYDYDPLEVYEWNFGARPLRHHGVLTCQPPS